MHAPTPQQDSDARTCERARVREAAFSTLELMIVVGVLIVLAAIGIIAFHGAKGATRAKEAQAAGAAYDQAISSWMADNANRAWPGATGTKGPIDLLGKAYVSAPPAGIEEGRVGVSMNGSTGCAGDPPATAAQLGYVAYCALAAPQYSVRVLWRQDPKSAWQQCWRGNSTRTPSCSNSK